MAISQNYKGLKRSNYLAAQKKGENKEKIKNEEKVPSLEVVEKVLG